MVNRYFAIIVAGGAGKRMNSDIPKQFLLINERPVIMHTIEKFRQSCYKPQIILVLPENEIERWNNLVEQFMFSVPHLVTTGGKERFFSVKNGLDLISGHLDEDQENIVAIHDAVRPLVSTQTIDRCFAKAEINGNAIASIPSRDSVRIQKNKENKAIPRESIYLIQTPQTFNYKQLKSSYLKEFKSFFTDDASVVESNSFKIFLEEGDQFNIKITFPEDIVLAEALLNKEK